jgi:hypothetical protein
MVETKDILQSRDRVCTIKIDPDASDESKTQAKFDNP